MEELVEKCVSKSMMSIVWDIISADGKIDRIEERSKINRVPGGLYMFYRKDNGEEYTGSRIQTWTQFYEVLVKIPNFQKLREYYETFIEDVSLDGNSSWGRFIIERYGTELSDQSTEYNAISTISNILALLNDESGNTLISELEANRTYIDEDSFLNAFYCVLSAVVKRNDNDSRVLDVLKIGRRQLDKDRYTCLLSDVFEIIKINGELLRKAILIEPQIANEAKGPKELEFCIKVCPKDTINEILLGGYYGNMSEEDCLRLNDDYLKFVIGRAQETIEAICSLTCTFDLEGFKEFKKLSKVYEYAFRFKEKSDGIPRSYGNDNQLVVLSPKKWAKFKDIVKKVGIFTGHNFKYWDNDILQENGIQISNEQVWDTLEVEIILDASQEGKRKNFALNVENGHQAVNDILTTEKLFRQQLSRILCSPLLFSNVKEIIPQFVAKRIQDFQQDFLKHNFWEELVAHKVYDESSHKSCLYDRVEDKEICYQLQASNNDSNTLIVADYSYWPRIAKEVPEIHFHYPDLEFCNPIDCEKIAEDFKKYSDVFHRYVLIRARNALSEKRYLKMSDIPDVILKHKFKTEDGKDERFQNELIKYIIPPSQECTIHCACYGKAVELLLTGDYHTVYLIGSQYRSEDVRLEGENYQTLKYDILSLEGYDDFVKRIDFKGCSEEIIKKYDSKYSELFSYWVYQPQRGDFEIKRQINYTNLKNYCIEKGYELLSNEIDIFPHDYFSVIQTAESVKCSINDASEKNRINFWRTQLEAILSLNLQNKVIVVDNLREARVLQKILTNKCKVIFNQKEALYKRLDKIREGRYSIGIAYLDEVLSEANENLNTTFSFILNDISLLFSSKDSLIESLYVLYKRINEHSTGSKLILLNPKPIDVIPECDIKHVSCMSHFSDGEINAIKTCLVEGNLISEDEVKDCERWIEEQILDNNYYSDKTLRDIQKRAIRRPIENKGENNNYLTIIPTGGGKSAIFQGPILYKSQRKQGYCKLNIVISPLQALMKDQIDSILGIPALFAVALQFCSSIEQNYTGKTLKDEVHNCKQLISKYKKASDKYTLEEFIKLLRNLIENQTIKKNKYLADQIEKIRYYLEKYDSRKNIVAYINASTSKDEQYEIIKRIQEHRLILLYIAPERLMIRSFFEGVIGAASKDQGIDSIVFDEAHCITGWGMDFRPAYILALRKILQLQERHSNISIHMFTATLPEQCRIELLKEIAIDKENIIPHIPEYNNSSRIIQPARDEESKEFKKYYESLCPIREHIALSAIRIPENATEETEQNKNGYFNEKIEYVFSSIIESKYLDINLLLNGTVNKQTEANEEDPAPSRMIVFTYSRNNAKEGSELLREKFLSIPEYDEKSNARVLSEKIGYFHAGLNKNEKDEIFEKYKDGRILILFSTKAFGLGMDIPNIHNVIHLTPPSFIEDYLQEVGRAGRSKDAYESAFPISENGKRETIKAVCLYSLQDIKKNKDRINRISWALITHAYKHILKYLDSFPANNDKFYAIPIDLLERFPIPDRAGVNENDDLKELFQQCLGWLSKQNTKYGKIESDGLDCVEIGYGCPDSFDIEVKDASTTGIGNDSNLFKLLDSIKEKGRTIVIANDIINDGRYNDVNNVYDVERIIDDGVAYGKFSKDFMYVSVSILNRERIGNFIESYYSDLLPIENDENIDLDELERITNSISADYGTSKISQLSVILKMYDLSQNFPNNSFSDLTQKAYEELKLSSNEIAYLSKKSITENSWKFVVEISLLYPLCDIIKACYKLLVTAYLKNARAISWKTITETTGTQKDPKLAKIILLLLKELHLISLGGFATDYIEVRIKDAKRVIQETPFKDSDDEKCEKELRQFYDSKEKKSGAMCGLIELMNSLNDRKEKNFSEIINSKKKELIKYYKSQKVDDAELIEQIQSMDGPDIAKQYIRIYSETDLCESGLSILQRNFDYMMVAAEKLAQTVGYELDDDQIKIYNEHPTQNISVRAGAGSGKTRLLAYWTLKLILDKHRNPSEILLLTYNRAVRNELEERIISYSETVGRTVLPKVYTFHEFALANVKNLKKTHKDCEGWEEVLLADIINNEGNQKYHYNYILIDEFQDVTTTRLEIVKRLCESSNSSGQHANMFVVGDERQSIYGYVKKNSVKDFLSSSELLTAIKNETGEPSNLIERIMDILVTKTDITTGGKNKLKNDLNSLLIENDGTVNIKKNELDNNEILNWISIEPEQYYSRLNNVLSSQVASLSLKNNYRSYQAIIDLAKQWIENDLISKRSHQVGKEECTICVVGDWKSIFKCHGDSPSVFETKIEDLRKRLIDEKRDFEKKPLEVGILFRSNAELFSANKWLIDWAGKHSDKYAKPIVQGADIHYYRTREFYFIAKLFRDKKDEIAAESSICSISTEDLLADKRKVFDEAILEVAKSLAKQIIKKNPGITFSQLLEKFEYIAQRERNNLKGVLEFDPDGRIRLIMSTIHKVKGMEYDAVIVPTSNYPTDMEDDYLDSDESLMEERRLMYVAYTRAKSLLFYQNGEREKCIKDGIQFNGEQNTNYAKNDLSKVTTAYLANPYHVNEMHYLDECKQGTPLVLQREDVRNWNEWRLYVEKDNNKLLVGRLSRDNKIVQYKSNNQWKEIRANDEKGNPIEYRGLFIKSVNVVDYVKAKAEDDQREARGEKQKMGKWSEVAKNLGYVYTVDYFGCITYERNDEN